MNPRHIIPGIVGVLTCGAIAGLGLWIGGVVGRAGGSTAPQTLSSTVTVKGQVITVGHTRKIRLPARTVTRNGAVVTIPARTVDLTHVLPGGTQTSYRTVSGGTVSVTVTGPTQTVPGPTTTQVSTVPGPTTTLTVTETVTGPTTTVPGPTTTVTETVTAPPTT